MYFSKMNFQEKTNMSVEKRPIAQKDKRIYSYIYIHFKI